MRERTLPNESDTRMARRSSSEFAVIGLGRFGSAVALNLIDRGFAVLGIDRRPAVVQELSDRIGQVVTLDSTSEEALRAVDIAAFDTAVVAIGTDFESNLITTYTLKGMGVQRVVCKATSERQREILLRVGADKVVLPEHDAGARLAWQLAEPRVLDHLDFGVGISVAEMVVPAWLVGQTLMNSALRKRYGINVIAVKRAGRMIVTPTPDIVFARDDVLHIIGDDGAIGRFCSQS